ncbi:uncharacterized protein LOC113311888 [Papaver somniferum]|uniref:uncharacterized protein LOC113311888 n=1 Tax=Papaver somniferum TaxID=3469 RepID=UPI000E6FE5CF|nr:uncharacterized protein LOC113311888 [Papaver somniferum]
MGEQSFDGKPAVVIPQDYYEEGCQIWCFSLIGRLDLKGIKLNDVKINLEQQWKLGEAKVQFIPMNRGFFIIKLLTQEYKENFYREGNKDPWIVNEQPLRLIEWYPGFDVDKQYTSHSTVWVKFPGLPVEMWVEKTLLALGKSLGTPIVVDKRTLNHEYGHYASVLIDIDFAKLNTDYVYVEAGGRNFLQPFEILKRPKYYSKCKIVGHLDSECRKKHVTAVNTPPVTASTSQQSHALVIHQGETNTAWQVAGQNKNGKKNRKGRVDNNVQPATVSIEDTVELEQQLEDELVNSEAILRRATAEFERAKQAKLAHSVLVNMEKSLSTVALNTKPVGNVELARTRLPNPVGETLNNPLLEINKVDEVAKRAKQQQLIALQAKIDALRDNDSMSDSEESELGVRARKGSSPRLKSSSNTSHPVKLSKTQTPKFNYAGSLLEHKWICS